MKFIIATSALVVVMASCSNPTGEATAPSVSATDVTHPDQLAHSPSPAAAAPAAGGLLGGLDPADKPVEGSPPGTDGEPDASVPNNTVPLSAPTVPAGTTPTMVAARVALTVFNDPNWATTVIADLDPAYAALIISEPRGPTELPPFRPVELITVEVDIGDPNTLFVAFDEITDVQNIRHVTAIEFDNINAARPLVVDVTPGRIAMAKLLAAGIALLAVPLLLLVTVVTLAIQGAAIAATTIQPTLPASQAALDDIPPQLLALYQSAAEACGGLPWQVLAGIGKVESNHGRYGGATIGPDGQISPPIIGIPLNGSNSTAAIADTDNGLYDRDRTWDRAVGPFQFIPTSWAIFGKDGNGDGFADPNNIYDAVPAAVAHLCPSGSIDNLEAAIFGYNHSNAYVADVLEWADTYSAPEGVVAAGDYAYPLPAAYATAALAGRSHHDYPAWDAGTPLGTPIFAMTTGTVITAHGTAGRFPADSNRCGNTVTIAGIDGAVYTYCHLSSVSVSVGQTVLPGTTLGGTGGQPGARGAGNTTGPHLHLGIRVGGVSVCPQPLLLGILAGAPIAPASLPRSGCTH